MTEALHWTEDRELTWQARKKLVAWASEGKTQRWIASQLECGFKEFERRMGKNKGDNDLRRAWEEGYALHEQDIVDDMLKVASGDGKGAMIALLFYCKARLGWSDKPDAPGTGADNRVQIVLPAPLTREQYFRQLGVPDPLAASGGMPPLGPPKDITAEVQVSIDGRQVLPVPVTGGGNG